MSDPFSIIAGIAGVSAVGVQLSISLYEISNKLITAPKEIADIASELAYLASIFDQLKSTLDDNRKLVRDQLIVTARETLGRFDALQKDITEIVANVGKGDAPWERLKWLFKDSRIASLMAKVNAVKASLNLLVSIIQIAVTVSTGTRKSGKKRPKSQIESEGHHRRLAESRAEAVRYTIRELRVLSVREQAASETQELLRFRHWKEPTSQTMSWLYYRTLASAVQGSHTGFLRRKSGFAKTVTTHNADETASESETDDEDSPQTWKQKGLPNSISPDEEDALWGESKLRSRAVDELLGDWTTMDKNQIHENAMSATSSKLPSCQGSFDRTIKATLKQMKSLMDLAVLNGCRIQSSGNITNDVGDVVGKLIKGDPEKLCKIKATFDDEGNVRFGTKRVGKAITVARVFTEGIPTKIKRPPAPDASEAFPPPPYVDAVSESEGKESVSLDSSVPETTSGGIWKIGTSSGEVKAAKAQADIDEQLVEEDPQMEKGQASGKGAKLVETASDQMVLVTEQKAAATSKEKIPAADVIQHDAKADEQELVGPRLEAPNDNVKPAADAPSGRQENPEQSTPAVLEPQEMTDDENNEPSADLELQDAVTFVDEEWGLPKRSKRGKKKKKESGKMEVTCSTAKGNSYSLSALERLCVESDGTILNLERVVIGRVIEGDAKKFASMMYFCDTQGNVVTYAGKPVGKVELVASATQMEPATGICEPIVSQEPEADEKSEMTKESSDHRRSPTTPKKDPLGIFPKLKGLKIDRFGEVLDADWVLVARLVDGNAKVLSRSGARCDEQGRIWIGNEQVEDAKIEIMEGVETVVLMGEKSTTAPKLSGENGTEDKTPEQRQSTPRDNIQENGQMNDGIDIADGIFSIEPSINLALPSSGLHVAKGDKVEETIDAKEKDEKTSKTNKDTVEDLLEVPWAWATTTKTTKSTDDTTAANDPLPLKHMNASSAITGGGTEISGSRKSVSFRNSTNTREHPITRRKLAPYPPSNFSMRSVSEYSGYDQVIHESETENSDTPAEPQVGVAGAEVYPRREQQSMRKARKSRQGTSSSAMSTSSSSTGRSDRPNIQASDRSSRHDPHRLNDSPLLSRDTNAFNPYYAVMPYQTSGIYPPMSNYYGHQFLPHPSVSTPLRSRAPEQDDDRVAPLQAELRNLQQQIAQQEITSAARKLGADLESRIKMMEEEALAKRRAETLETFKGHVLEQNLKTIQLEQQLLAAQEAADTYSQSLAELERVSQAEKEHQQQALRTAREEAKMLSSLAIEAEQTAASKHEEMIKLAQQEAERGVKLFAEHKQNLAKYQEKLDAEVQARERAEDARKELENQMRELRDAQGQSTPHWTETYYAPAQTTKPRQAYLEEDQSSIASGEGSISAIADTATETTQATRPTQSGIVRVTKADLDADPSQVIVFPRRMGWKEHEYKLLTRSMLRFGFQPFFEEGAEMPCVPSQFYERPGSGGCELRGTALWHPPGPSLASDLYTSFLKSGWKPSYVRSNEYGETWFLGRQPVHVILFSINYIPQAMIDDPSKLDHQYAEKGKLYLSNEYVEKEVLDEIGYQYTMLPDWRISLDPKLTHADIETIVARSFLMRETRLRKQYRDSTPTGNPSIGRFEDLGSSFGSVRNSSSSLLSVNKPSRIRAFLTRSSSRTGGSTS